MDVDTETLGSLSALAREALEACDAVIARVWMVGRGDLCSTCAMASECPERSRCLHLVVSDGLTRRIDGPFRRFPIGARAYVNEWSRHGPAHHCAVGLGHVAAKIEKLASLLDMEFARVC